MDYEDDDGSQEHFQNPESFLNQFGGYETDHSEDPNDDDEENDHVLPSSSGVFLLTSGRSF